ncbi:hypothetical protein ASPVEDRAFT_82574 [Aspergillus versicolor CBS 583.65]|uniref:Cyclin-domain-containing protein n=1 Tax=Aspergillus versicolor CBS 583.65 TaxID=1036611 RepID=A0A1L9PHP3_ASPVE|nr:uncharacterized protein ASPVEDRAFT_82574 [Aspergillus versicolor CBS 583.65]OJJ01028.1 hypothetical protein ASPVEDRAFT_82574 [Aspergillus versicolor CBS 583.65]
MNVCTAEGESLVDKINIKQTLGFLSLPKEAENDTNFNSPDVFDIKPEQALELLCVCMDKLEAMQTINMLGAQDGDSYPGPEDTPAQAPELHVYGDGRDRMQQSLLSRRFMSKREPPITLRGYLSRLHRYCPLSTGVYLAASLFITRIANVDRALAVNRKNIHRLVLAGLRVAMKTLEDISYSHGRVAKVGGVSEWELTRLELSFCFLADFELRVDKQMLAEQARVLQWHMTHSSSPNLVT